MHSSPHARVGLLMAVTCAACRAQRAQAQKASKVAQPPVVVLYASQTGTAQEIARSIQATSGEHGIKSQVHASDSGLRAAGFCACAGMTWQVHCVWTLPSCYINLFDGLMLQVNMLNR